MDVTSQLNFLRNVLKTCPHSVLDEKNTSYRHSVLVVLNRQTLGDEVVLPPPRPISPVMRKPETRMYPAPRALMASRTKSEAESRPKNTLRILDEVFGYKPMLAPETFYNRDLLVLFFKENTMGVSRLKVRALLSAPALLFACTLSLRSKSGRLISGYLAGNFAEKLEECYRFLSAREPQVATVEPKDRSEAKFVKAYIAAMEIAADSSDDDAPGKAFVALAGGRTLSESKARIEKGKRVLWLSTPVLPESALIKPWN